MRAIFQAAIFSCVLTRQKGARELCGVPFTKARIPKGPHLILLHWGLRFPYLNRQGDTNIQSIVPSAPYKCCYYSHVPGHEICLGSTCQSSHVFPQISACPTAVFHKPPHFSKPIYSLSPKYFEAWKPSPLIPPPTLNPRLPSAY